MRLGADFPLSVLTGQGAGPRGLPAGDDLGPNTVDSLSTAIEIASRFLPTHLGLDGQTVISAGALSWL
jgi:hypothetical protein